jgi:HPt (histidine-containing phosphotransfer) domain-containing protein
MSDPPLIDRATLDELIESIGADGAHSVIELFIAESRGHLATIAAAAAAPLDSAARERARGAAHSLKSAAGQIGAAAMSAGAAAVELAAAAGTADLAQSIAALERCAAATNPALAAFLGR